MSDLTAEDFTLTVDGKPRRIASAQFISVDARASRRRRPSRGVHLERGRGGRPAGDARRSTRATSAPAAASRRSTRRSASSATLNRADRVALVTLAGRRAADRVHLQPRHRPDAARATSSARRPRPSGQKRVGLSEALAIQRERPDRRSTRSSIASARRIRRAAMPRAAACSSSPARRSRCCRRSRERTRNSLISLRYLFERMADQRHAEDHRLPLRRAAARSRQRRRRVDRAARRRGAHHPVRAAARHAGDGRGGSARTSPSRGEDREVLRQGLDQLAGMASGDVFRIVGERRLRVPAPGAGAVRLLPSELRAAARRSRRQAAQDPDRRPAQGPDAALAARVQRRPARLARDRGRRRSRRCARRCSPTDIPLKLTTYTFQDPESSKLKIILAADIDRSLQSRRASCRSAT